MQIQEKKWWQQWQDWKYLIAYVAPLAAYWGIYTKGHWSFAGIYVGFVLIPLAELILPPAPANLPQELEPSRAKMRFFDVLLYLNVPLLYGLMAYYFYTLQQGGLAPFEIIGMTCSVGLIVGTVGINVAHELGHRSHPGEQWLAQVLLLSALYQHFFIEHNRGHHKHVATPADPATARYGESIYIFWVRSVLGSYHNAWQLELERLDQAGLRRWGWHNAMVRYTVYNLGYLGAVGLLYSISMVGYAVAIAVFGFLLLESVNYIEHYGLLRRRLESGRYEPVGPQHSWNSDHEVGRIFLYELTRHSDHHFKASRKYQILRHFDASPQLPFGYPTSIILALLPPLWFALMNRRVQTLSTAAG